MTLIAAFRTSEGVIICADSQETVGNPTIYGAQDYRCTVNKLQPQTHGGYQWVCGGSGDGDLADGFIERLRDEIGDWPDNWQASEIKDKLRLMNNDYRSHEVAASGIADEPLTFLFCLKDQDSQSEPVLFKIGRSVRPVEDYALVGWDEGIYKHDVQRFYRPNAGGLPNMLLGIHVLLLAIATNNNCGPPIKIIVVTAKGITELNQKRVSELSERVTIFNQMVDQITLDLSDTTVPIQEFRDRVTQFRDNVVILHDHYINNHVWDSLGQVFFNKDWKPDAIQELPSDSLVTRTKEGDQTVVEFKHTWTFVEDLLDDDLNKG